MDDKSIVAMTPQQKKFTESGSRLGTYRQLVVGNKGWGTLIGFEAYNFFLGNMPSLPGYGFRSLIFPSFLKKCSGGVTIGRGVTVRQPHAISLGRGVVIDDYAVLDVRSDESQEVESSLELGDRVLIGRSTTVAAKLGSVKLAAGCNVGSYCRLSTQSSIEIGESTLVAAYVYIGPGNHKIDDFEKPIMEQEMEIRGGVKIGRNVWIGTRATILDGVTIGDSAVIGAHSLVTEDVPDGAVVAGTPAKVIRYRT